MKHLPLRIGAMATFTLALSAVVVRLVWEFTIPLSMGSLVIIILVILALLGIYALILYLFIAPSLKKLKSLPVGIGITGIFTAAFFGAIVHFIRFVPSPEAASPLSIVIATLLLMAAIGVYILILWVIWSIWKARES